MPWENVDRFERIEITYNSNIHPQTYIKLHGH